jgi:hypothetical protein
MAAAWETLGGGGNSDLLGWIQGRVGIWPKAKIEKRKNPFKFSKPFYNFTQFLLTK